MGPWLWGAPRLGGEAGRGNTTAAPGVERRRQDTERRGRSGKRGGFSRAQRGGDFVEGKCGSWACSAGQGWSGAPEKGGWEPRSLSRDSALPPLPPRPPAHSPPLPLPLSPFSSLLSPFCPLSSPSMPPPPFLIFFPLCFLLFPLNYFLTMDGLTTSWNLPDTHDRTPREPSSLCQTPDVGKKWELDGTWANSVAAEAAPWLRMRAAYPPPGERSTLRQESGPADTGPDPALSYVTCMTSSPSQCLSEIRFPRILFCKKRVNWGSLFTGLP